MKRAAWPTFRKVFPARRAKRAGMIVYGDIETAEDPRARLAALAADLAALGHEPPGLSHHAALAAVFVGASELAQGLADAAFAAAGADDAGGDRAQTLVRALAAALLASWTGDFRTPDLQPARAALDRLIAEPDLPATIRCRQAEGFAHYALYPEGYAAAAATLPPPWLVIGLRSIGLGLAAIVAAGTNAACVSLRPVGPPFRRELAVSSALAARLLADRNAPIAIVDEGPGLSGSSFGAVADWLEDRGVPATRIQFLPGHNGDLGPEAAPRHKARWTSASRPVVDFDALILNAPTPAHRLAAWVADVVGPLDAPLRDVSGGAWRALAYPDEDQWPGVWAGAERRKFFGRAQGRPFLVKFAGLGGGATRKAHLARALGEAGFSPRLLGRVYGFTIETWHEGAKRLDSTRRPAVTWLDRLAAYLAFRARHFAAPDAPGASLADLQVMAVRNLTLALGHTADLDRWLPRLPALQAARRPIRIDGRLAACEWLVEPDGRILKTDAVDHHAAHDLIGCQDVAWDVAGAAVELGLDPDATEELRLEVEALSGYPVSAELTAFCRIAYTAFAIGRLTMALNSEGRDGERRRLLDARNSLDLTIVSAR